MGVWATSLQEPTCEGHSSAPNEHVVSSFEANTRTTMDEQLRAAQLAGARPPALPPPPQGASDPPRRARPGAGYMQPTAVQASAPEELALLAVRRGYIPTHSSRAALTHHAHHAWPPQHKKNRRPKSTKEIAKGIVGQDGAARRLEPCGHGYTCEWHEVFGA